MDALNQSVALSLLAAALVLIFGMTLSSWSYGQEYAGVPVLHQGVSSDHFELVAIDTGYRANITFSPQGQFFVVADQHIQVFDARGRRRFLLETSPDLERLPLTHYVVSANGVYDLSQPEPVLEPFAQRINDIPGMTLSRKTSERAFRQAYRNADVALFGREMWGSGKLPCYLKTDDEWVLFYLSLDTIELDYDADLGTKVDGFPGKFDKLVYLADPFSGELAAESSRIRDSEIPLPEDRLTYLTRGEIRTLSFEPVQVLDRSNYLQVPMSHTGPAVYELTVGGEQLRFREFAVKPVLGARESQLNWYVLPEIYRDVSVVSFLEFNPYSSSTSIGEHGVYILRARH